MNAVVSSATPMSPTVTIRTMDIVRRVPVSGTTYNLAPGMSYLIGRSGDIPVAVSPRDSGVSRHAITLVAGDDGWSLSSTNTAGAVLQPWGQAPAWINGTGEQTHRWSRLAVRLIGAAANHHHWILLEDDRYTRAAKRVPRDTTDTYLPGRPPPLTTAQLEAVNAVFAQHLSWPPVAGPTPMPLIAVARRLGIGPTAVQQRLDAAQKRAYQLGQHRQYTLSEPDYLYTLVRHGYLPDPPRMATLG